MFSMVGSRSFDDFTNMYGDDHHVFGIRWDTCSKIKIKEAFLA